MSGPTVPTPLNVADLFEAHAAANPHALALVHGATRRTWREFNLRADGLAACLLAAGVGRQVPVAQYLHNGPEYLESVLACFKASLAPANTNHRYGSGELAQVWADAEAEAVVYHGAFRDRVDEVRRSRSTKVRLWIQVDDQTHPSPDWAVPYEDAVASTGGAPHTVAPEGRSGDDLFLLYTGGTTGMPKGVMWRQEDLLANLLPRTDVAPGRLHLPACPLIHGTGSLTSLSALAEGGTILTLTGRTFDPVELLDAVDHEQVRTVAIVGDPFARPLLDALDAEPTRWDISSLTHIISSGVAWSDAVKEGLLRHHPDLALVDTFGSSEAIGVGRSVTRRGGRPITAGRFRVDDRTRVIDDDDEDVTPGSGRPGRIAVAGRGPIGYLGDPERSARTFPVIDGVRHTITGDLATVEADGTIVLLGRGSACINTGGEKVFPEEVEEALKSHPAVADAAVVGIPDPRWGEAVSALVQLHPPAVAAAADLILTVKARLAGYKAPRHIVFGPVQRQPTGKLDYAAVRDRVLAATGPSTLT